MSTAYELARDERYPDWHEVARERWPKPVGERVSSPSDVAARTHRKNDAERGAA